MSLRYLSVCSGIEAASVAWEPLGWQPLAFAEVAKFPRRVLAHRFPQVPLHGDFTVLRDEPWIAGADLLVGGTPCQAFSVAGLRGSLSDARGNLTIEFVRLADAIDDFRCDHGREPAWILWENVPGVLNTADNAFGALLGGLAGSDAAIEHAGGWPSAGVVAGPRRVVAWRTLDAQYFGVAQRRRRVFVLALAGAGGWAAADALLPIAEGSGGDSAPCRDEGEGLAGTSAYGVASTLRCRRQSLDAAFVFQPQASVSQGLSMSADVAPTLGTTKVPAIVPALVASFAKYRGQDNQHINAGAPWFVGARPRMLTPTEWERLQGFPDGWTAINGNATPDSPRYHALGNSMAVPVMRWIGKQINKARNR
jgi:DNA (cytosine-5)-methyltransferase 1